MSDDRIGIVGPGRMGLAIVKHLVKAGYAVIATDVSAEQLAKAAEAGAETAASAAELGAACGFVIVAVGYDDETRADTVKEVAAAAAEKGIGIYDAPICRGRWAADDGTLLALVGGDAEVVARAEPVYATFCSDIAHLGDVGAGQVGKAMNNFLMWVNGIALIEAGRLCEALGMDLPKLREALLMSSGKSAALEDWDRMTFTWAHKDMQVVSKLTDETGLALPIAGAIREMVKDGRRIKATNPPDWTGEGGIAKRP
jgi:3-hydroxyisobutyrate dehydrogenase/2-hydroxy-3-oxopropionate reductase